MFESEGQGGDDLTEKPVKETVEGNVDTEMQSPPKETSPTLEQPPIPQDSPPKDPSPPHSKSDTTESSSSSDHSPPPSKEKLFVKRMKKASLRTKRALLRAKQTAGTTRSRRTPQVQQGDLQDQLNKMKTLVEKLSK